MSKNNNFSMHFPSFLKSSAYLATFTAGTMLLLCGCGDARKVTELLARIEALEKRQEEDGIKLAGMSEKIVTKAIDVQGTIKSESLEVRDIIKSGLIDIGDIYEKVSISRDGIVISSLDYNRKTGAISRYDSGSFKIENYESNKGKGVPTFKGAGIVFSAGRLAGESEFKMWSFTEEPSKTFWRRDLKTESVLSSEVLLIGGGTAFVGSNSHFNFAVNLISVSEDGIVRFELANLSTLSAKTIRGTIQTVTGQGADKKASFVIDQTMTTGKLLAVAVDIGVKKKDAIFITLKDLQVDSFTF